MINNKLINKRFITFTSCRPKKIKMVNQICYSLTNKINIKKICKKIIMMFCPIYNFISSYLYYARATNFLGSLYPIKRVIIIIIIFLFLKYHLLLLFYKLILLFLPLFLIAQLRWNTFFLIIFNDVT